MTRLSEGPSAAAGAQLPTSPTGTSLQRLAEQYWTARRRPVRAALRGPALDKRGAR